MDFAALLVKARKRAKLHQWGLAEKTEKFGISRSLISLIETGGRTPPLESLGHLMDALGLTGDARREFQEAAYLAHAPAELQGLVSRIQAQLLKRSEEVVALQTERSNLRAKVFELNAEVFELNAKLTTLATAVRKLGVNLPKSFDDTGESAD